MNEKMNGWSSLSGEQSTFLRVSRVGTKLKGSCFLQGRAFSSPPYSLCMNEEPAPKRMQVTGWNSEAECEVISWKVTVSSERFGP